MQQKNDPLEFYMNWAPYYQKVLQAFFVSTTTLSETSKELLMETLINLDMEIYELKSLSRKSLESIIQSLSAAYSLFSQNELISCATPLNDFLQIAIYFLPNIRDLPPELIQTVFLQYLHGKDLLNFSQTCTFFNKISGPSISTRMYKPRSTTIAAGLSHIVICKNNKLFCFGDNSHSQLGSNNSSSKREEITLPENRIPRHVISKNNYTLVLSECDKVFALGYHSIGEISTRGPFQEITISQKVIRDFAIGTNHSLFLCTDGTLFGMGDNRAIQLGHTVHEFQFCGNLKQIDLPWGQKVNKVFAFYNDSLVVCDDGVVYVFGQSTALLPRTSCRGFSQKEIDIPKGKEIMQVDKGKMLFTDGSLYNLSPIKAAPYFSLTLIDLPGKAIRVSSGNSHTLILLEDGTLLASGRNNLGQLGLGHNDDVLTFTEVKLPNGQQVDKFCCGSNSSVIQTREGTVFAFGCEESIVTSLEEFNPPARHCSIM